jgi:hypothetical protein
VKKRPVLWIVVALNLVVLVALAFVYPHLMVSPGPLVKGHETLATDCFACHSALRGASTQRCTECHAVADVGLKTTKGVPIPTRTVKVSFHQELVEQDCMACHSDHQGPKLTKRSRKPFSHALLKVAVKDQCSSCHGAPKDTVHRDIKLECSQCHGDKAWKPAHFEHKLLAPVVLDRCESCHNAPNDRMGSSVLGVCCLICSGSIPGDRPGDLPAEYRFDFARSSTTAAETSPPASAKSDGSDRQQRRGCPGVSR